MELVQRIELDRVFNPDILNKTFLVIKNI